MSEATLVAEGVAVGSGPRALLRPTSLSVRSGAITAAAGDPGHGHTALALALAGRLPLTAGRVVPGDARERQRLVGLVDVPGVSEPDDVLPVRTVIGEDLAMARASASRSAVRSAAADLGVRAALDERFDHLGPAERSRLLLALTARRRGVQFLVLCLPERYGALVPDWLPAAQTHAAEGFGVLVTVGRQTARTLSDSHPEIAVAAIGSEMIA